jgi:ADP-ribosylglycohydrolase
MNERAIIGCLLGTAVGDAIGLPYEGLSPRRARRMLGPPDRHRFLFGRGMISDDTEHACMVAEALVSSSDVESFERELARRLRNWLRLVPAGIGLATLRACLKLNLGFGPERSGVFSAGNGPCMRGAILGVAIDDVDRLCAYVARSARITHTNSEAACGAFAIALAARAAAKNRRPEQNELTEELARRCPNEASQELVESPHKVWESITRRESTAEFATSIGQSRGVSGYVNHTVPIALHAAWLHPQDFRAAVESVIECGGDTDTTAALVGGIVGAAVGKEGIPAEWLNGIWDSPRSVSWIENLGRGLAASVSTEKPHNVSTCPWFRLLLRNAFFATVVLTHGFRRLLPPY